MVWLFLACFKLIFWSDISGRLNSCLPFRLPSEMSPTVLFRKVPSVSQLQRQPEPSLLGPWLRFQVPLLPCPPRQQTGIRGLGQVILCSFLILMTKSLIWKHAIMNLRFKTQIYFPPLVFTLIHGNFRAPSIFSRMDRVPKRYLSECIASSWWVPHIVSLIRMD